MNKKNSKKNVDLFDKFGYIRDLLGKAVILSESENDTDILASATISSAVAEDIADLIYERVSLEVDKKMLNEKVRFISQKLKDKGLEKTNLGASQTRLDYFEFPYKQDLMGLIGVIKKDRDRLLHKLFKLPEENLNIKLVGKNIFKNTNKLMKIWILFGKEFDNNLIK